MPKISYVQEKVAAEFQVRFCISTYVYGEPLCVLQIAKYFIRRKSNAFIHGMSTCAPVKSYAFRHGRYWWT